jgi:hypothetical protein
MRAKNLFVLFVTAITLLTSCGPSQEEIKRREQAIADSIFQVFKQKQLEEEEQKKRLIEIEKEETRRQLEYESRPEVIKQRLLLTEKENPLDYLSISFSLSNRIISGNTILKGRISSIATLATFKDVEIVIQCYTKTNSYLQAYSHVVYDFIYPNKSTNFEVQFRPPNGTENIRVQIINAKTN